MTLRVRAIWALIVPLTLSLLIGSTAVPAGAESGKLKRDYSKKLQSKVKEPEAPPEKPKYKPWGKVVTKDHEKLEGLITIYRKGEEVLFDLGEETMDKPMLAILSLSQGIGSNFVLGGLPIDDVLFDFHRVEDHIQLRRLSLRYRAPGDEKLQNALDLTFSESILESWPIAAEKDGRVVVDVTKYYLSDGAGMSMWLGAVLGQPVRLDKSKGYYDGVRNYPENTEIDTRLTYSPGRPQALNLPNVPDPRYIQVGVHYSIRKLPENPMPARIADDRVGYFTETFKDFTRPGAPDFYVHYANRWRLEKKDPAAAVSDPVQPIVYYVDNTVPDQYAPYIKAGIEMWQRAFEKAGFSNAIIGKYAPTPEEDPDYNPEDARYNTFRWNTSDRPSYVAIGPSRVDPRTGEILDADILLEQQAINSYTNMWHRYGSPREALMSIDPLLHDAWATEEEKALDPMSNPFLRDKLADQCRLGEGMQMDLHLGYLWLASNGLIQENPDIPEEFIGQFLMFVAAHEVGHTLGLRHNFKSSGATPFDRLNDKALVEEIGMAGSVMDYPTPNISPDPSKQGYYYSPNVGSYDDWAITWGYSDVEGDGPYGEAPALAKIAERSTETALYYGTDWDAYPAGAMDPRTNIWDLSNDPVRWGAERKSICADLLQGDDMITRTIGGGESYVPLRNGIITLYLQIYRVTSIAAGNIGGQYTVEVYKGADMDPMQPVPASRQREALAFVLNDGLASKNYVLAPDMLNKLVANKRSSWANNPYQPGRRWDFPMSNWAAGLQRGLLFNLLNPVRQERMLEVEYKASGDVFALSDLYSELTGFIWTDNVVPKGQTAGMDRALQRTYTDILVMQLMTPNPFLPQDAIALSRLHLRRIKRDAEGALQRSGLGDMANAHLMETVARIDRALDPQRVAGF